MRMEKFQSDSSNSFPVCNFFFLKEICSDEEKCVFKRDFLKDTGGWCVPWMMDSNTSPN